MTPGTNNKWTFREVDNGYVEVTDGTAWRCILPPDLALDIVTKHNLTVKQKEEYPLAAVVLGWFVVVWVVVLISALVIRTVAHLVY